VTLYWTTWIRNGLQLKRLWGNGLKVKLKAKEVDRVLSNL
jgi:hypothetical protein